MENIAELEKTVAFKGNKGKGKGTLLEKVYRKVIDFFNKKGYMPIFEEINWSTICVDQDKNLLHTLFEVATNVNLLQNLEEFCS